MLNLLGPIDFGYYYSPFALGGLNILENDFFPLPDFSFYSPFPFGWNDGIIGRGFYGSLFYPNWFEGMLYTRPVYERWDIGIAVLMWGEFDPFNPWSWLV